MQNTFNSGSTGNSDTSGTGTTGSTTGTSSKTGGTTTTTPMGGTGTTGGTSTSQSAGFSTETSRQSEPATYTRGSFDADTRRSDESLFTKASRNSTGIAVGIAVGAIAATAIPFMFAGKSRSSDRRDYSARSTEIDFESDRTTEGRTTTTAGSASRSDYSSKL